jgi:predicted NBD/HSP70 family sugar kinase
MRRSGKPRFSKSEGAKRNILLQSLHRRGSGSRVTLARALNISNSRVCDLIEQMVADGLLLEDQVSGDRRGRRGVSVSLNPSYGQFIGFDMEAKRLRMVVTDFTGQVIWQNRHPLSPPKNRDALITEILSFITSSLTDIRAKFNNLLGFGIAASGVIDAKRGTILHYDLLPHMIDVPVRELIARHVEMPCVMDNNIRAMTLAEWVGGAAKGLHSFVCLAVRSGVGAGIVLNGRLRGGSHGFCGEIGYMIATNGNGNGGTVKTLQQSVSESALGIDVEAEGFDKLSESTAKRCGELIGISLAAIAAMLDPEAFILAGGMLNPLGPVWPHVYKSFRKHALAELVERVHLIPARLGPFAAAQGAAHRALHELFPVHVMVTV